MNAETLYEQKLKPNKALSYALEHQIPLVIWLGESEIEEGVATVKVSCE